MIATFDVGTTEVKGVLVSESGEVVLTKSVEIKTYFDNGYIEQNPEDWYEAFCQISNYFVGGVHGKITDVIMSGQMQDVILMDKDRKSIGKAILYSDSRAEIQAGIINKKIGKETLKKSTGNDVNATIPIAKIAWIKENDYSAYQRTEKIVFSSKDYCLAQLTGCFVTDIVTASTVGAMDIMLKEWSQTIIDKAGVSLDKFPQLKSPHDKIGRVSEEASRLTGLSTDTFVYAGTGDAGATTLASGVSNQGDININIGTSGWVAGIYNNPLEIDSVFNLAAINSDMYIGVVPFLNAGNVHRWITSTIAPESDNLEDSFNYINGLLEKNPENKSGVLFLPYLVGERFPEQDGNTKGCFIGITAETSKSDMVYACLEGVAYSIKLGIDKMDIEIKRLSIIGGGAKFDKWCQIISNILNIKIEVSNESQFLPSIAIASCVLYGQAKISSYSEFIDKSIEKCGKKTFYPEKEKAEKYDALYGKFKLIYPNVKNIFVDLN